MSILIKTQVVIDDIVAKLLISQPAMAEPPAEDRQVIIPKEWVDEIKARAQQDELKHAENPAQDLHYKNLITDLVRADAANVKTAIEQAIFQGESRWTLTIPNLHGTTPARIKQLCNCIAETDAVPDFLANRLQVSSTEPEGTYLLELRLFAGDF